MSQVEVILLRASSSIYLYLLSVKLLTIVPAWAACTYLNSYFPMPHSPPVTENIPKATSHPLVWFPWHSAASADPHVSIWHQPRPISHHSQAAGREGWPEHTSSAAWFSSHRWDAGTWGFRNLCCDLCSTSLQQRLTAHWLGVPETCATRSRKNIQVRMFAPGLGHLQLKHFFHTVLNKEVI